MARGLLVLAALTPAYFGGNAAAVTTVPARPQPWNGVDPHPCADLCSPRWALDRMRGVMPPEVYRTLLDRLDGADAVDYRVVTGDQIRAMTQVEDGEPFVDFSRHLAQFPQGVDYPARGHFVMHDGVLYRFVRITASGNWALIVGQESEVLWPERSWPPGGVDDVIVGGTGDASGLLAGGFGGGGGGGGGFGGRSPLFGRPVAGAAFPAPGRQWISFVPPFAAGPPLPEGSSSSSSAGSGDAHSLPQSDDTWLFPAEGNPLLPDPRPRAGETLPLPVPLPGALVLCAGWLAALGSIGLRRA